MASSPLQYGVNDCAIMAADATQMATGFDPMSDLRGAYSSRWEYLCLAREQGGLNGMAKARLGYFPPMTDGDGVGLLVSSGQSFFATRLNGRWVARRDHQGASCLSTLDSWRVLEAWQWFN